MIGVAPNCRPECLLTSDCPSNQACINQACVDPCPGTCASNAECVVVNHSPVCNCQSGFTGNAFSDCRAVPAVGNYFILIGEFLKIASSLITKELFFYDDYYLL